MTKSKLRKIAIVLSALAVLSGGFGIDTAHARGGGGFGGGGFGGGHIGGFGGGLIGDEFGGGHLRGGEHAIHPGRASAVLGHVGVDRLRAQA